jgi:hypothetical protein
MLFLVFWTRDEASAQNGANFLRTSMLGVCLRQAFLRCLNEAPLRIIRLTS